MHGWLSTISAQRTRLGPATLVPRPDGCRPGRKFWCADRVACRRPGADRPMRQHVQADRLPHRPRRLLGLLPVARRRAHLRLSRLAATSRSMGCTSPDLPAPDHAAAAPTAASSTLNLLDEGLLPYTRINGSTFPAPTRASSARHAEARPIPTTRQERQTSCAQSPDTFDGEPVNF